MRQTKERVLKMLIDESCERKSEHRNKKINKKYKMVKFFGVLLKHASHVRNILYLEKRKVTRKLKSLINQLSRTSNDKDQERYIIICHNNNIYFPLLMHWQSSAISRHTTTKG